MDKGQLLTGMKKNAVSISAGVVALAALGVTFFVVNPMIDDLDKQVADRAAKEDVINSLISKPRQQVQVAISSASESDQPLNQFPTSLVIQSGKETMEQVKAQADSVVQAAVDTNRRVPLPFTNVETEYEAAAQLWPLEGERESIERNNYQRAYRTYVNVDNELINGSYPPRSLPGLMRATRPPTAEEVSTNLSQLSAKLESQVPRNAQGQPLDPEGLAARIDQESSTLATQMKYDRARNHLFYLDANTAASGLTVHEIAAQDRQELTAEGIFDAQMQLWVQESVLANVVRANIEAMTEVPEEQRNILNAPIKHVLNIATQPFLGEAAVGGGTTPGGFGPPGGFPGGMPGEFGGEFLPGEFGGYPGGMPGEMPGGMPGAAPGATPGAAPATPGAGGAVRAGGRPGAGEAAEPEVDVPNDPSAELERNFTYSASGRVPHNPVYDVMYFNVTLRCDAQSVPYVIKALQQNSLITVLNLDMTMVDLAVAAQQGYVYGDRPVVELDLQCEMLFLRQWTLPLMPTTTKQALASWGGAATETTTGF